MSNVPGGPTPITPGVPTAPAGTGELADFITRAIASIIDWVIVGVVVSILGKIFLIGSLFGLVIGLGYFFYCWAYDNPIGLKGQTLGKKVMNIKVVMDNGMDLTPQQAGVRCLGYLVTLVTLGLGCLLALRPDRKALHDMIAGTKVIKV
jgi:uncharacterized RDD family membrane protein YckC